MATYESVKYSFAGNVVTALQSPNIANGSVTNTEFQTLSDISTVQTIQTQLNTKFGSAGGTFTGNVTLNDSIHLYLGTGGSTDLDLYMDGSNGYIKNSTGNLNINSDSVFVRDDDNTVNMFNATSTGAFNAYYNNSLKLTTTNTGATTTGVHVATTFSGSGASLTNLPAANLTGTYPDLNGASITSLNATHLASGTVPDGRFPATLPAASAANLTSIPAANLTGTAAAINGSSITSLNASNLASGTVPDARLPASALTSDYVKLGTATTGGSAASSLALAGSPGGFSSDYKHYKIILDGKWQTSGTAATYFGLRISTDAGSSYASSGYFFAQLFAATNANNWTYEDTTMLKFARYIPYTSTSPSTRNLSSEITIFDANGSNYKPVAAAGAGFDRNLDGTQWQIVGGVIENTSAIDGVQFVIADGSNISAGSSFTLYGLK